MDGQTREVLRIGWELKCVAEPEELAALRRIIRLHLVQWGLPHVVDTAQLCVSELVTNVIDHVGVGTPMVLGLSMRGTHVRIEVRDPDPRALPTLVAAERDAEGGRGMAIVSEVAERWGVLPGPDSKVTWCELAAGGGVPNGHMITPHVDRAEEVIKAYGSATDSRAGIRSRLSTTVAEEAAIDVIADLLHWLRAHGCDPENALDRAQVHFEAEIEEAGCSIGQ